MFASHHNQRARGPSKADVCKGSGCNCYCHEPQPRPSWALIIIGITLAAFWWVPLKWAIDSERNACEKTLTCEVCDVTSTGASYNCRPDPTFGKNVTIRKDSR